jgi:hypothetical protein
VDGLYALGELSCEPLLDNCKEATSVNSCDGKCNDGYGKSLIGGGYTCIKIPTGCKPGLFSLETSFGCQSCDVPNTWATRVERVGFNYFQKCTKFDEKLNDKKSASIRAAISGAVLLMIATLLF